MEYVGLGIYHFKCMGCVHYCNIYCTPLSRRDEKFLYFSGFESMCFIENKSDSVAQSSHCVYVAFISFLSMVRNMLGLKMLFL